MKYFILRLTMIISAATTWFTYISHLTEVYVSCDMITFWKGGNEEYCCIAHLGSMQPTSYLAYLASGINS